mmetsp:Transcript_110384/g.312155  ORF Transcript_110384/g.312155 Transcript_110384/m.312155 type:complete len:354 (+) Transcript_110384:1216-2277(+)
MKDAVWLRGKQLPELSSGDDAMAKACEREVGIVFGPDGSGHAVNGRRHCTLVQTCQNLLPGHDPTQHATRGARRSLKLLLPSLGRPAPGLIERRSLRAVVHGVVVVEHLAKEALRVILVLLWAAHVSMPARIDVIRGREDPVGVPPLQLQVHAVTLRRGSEKLGVAVVRQRHLRQERHLALAGGDDVVVEAGRAERGLALVQQGRLLQPRGLVGLLRQAAAPALLLPAPARLAEAPLARARRRVAGRGRHLRRAQAQLPAEPARVLAVLARGERVHVPDPGHVQRRGQGAGLVGRAPAQERDPDLRVAAHGSADHRMIEVEAGATVDLEQEVNHPGNLLFKVDREAICHLAAS